MALINFGKKEGNYGYLAVNDQDKSISVKEGFKGEVLDIPVKFPKELGSEHPFDFEATEKVFKRVGFVNGIINKIKNEIVGEFSVKVKNKNAQSIIDDFIYKTNMGSILREWIKEGLVKGNGFIELDIKNSNLRVLNANHMYVERDSKGKIKGYNQFLGQLKNFQRDSKKITPFKPNQIAHLKINKIANEPYACGLIWPNERVIENIVTGEQDDHKLIKRKAGSPIHVRIGAPGEPARIEDIDAFSSSLKYMNTRTEWITDGNVELKVLDFGSLGEPIINTINHDMEMLSTGFDLPMVLMGKANLPEGLAKVQMESHQRKIIAMRQEVGKVIEENIFKPLLKENKFDESIEFEWDMPGETETNNRIEKIKGLLSIQTLGPNVRRALEIEIARLFQLEDLEKVLPKPEKGLEEIEKKEEREIQQPEVPGAKPNANQLYEKMSGCGCGQQLEESQIKEMDIKEWVSLQEIEGFNYTDYLLNILKLLKTEKFEFLLAKTEQDIKDGLLPKKEIEKLRLTMSEGFKENWTMAQIEKEIKDEIDLKDRTKNGKITMASQLRPENIARTETVRLANKGLLETYKQNDIKQVRFLAALSERTCPECESLNGTVYNINEADGIIPAHQRCRCSWTALVD